MFLAHIQEHIAFKARAIVQEQLIQATQGDPRLMQSIPPEQVESNVANVEAQLNAEVLQQLMPQGEEQDPLVAIRQQELMIQAAESERKARLDDAKIQLERQQLQQRATTDSARIESQEDIADQRAAVNLERIRVSQQNRS